MRQRAYEAAVHDAGRRRRSTTCSRPGPGSPTSTSPRRPSSEARAQIEQVKTEIDRATVVAPVDGVVLQVNVRAGERVSDRDRQGPDGAWATSAPTTSASISTSATSPASAAERRPRPIRAARRPTRLRCDSCASSRLSCPRSRLTGDNTERVDTRVLQVLFAIEQADHPVYVGQQLDVFISGVASTATEAVVSR